MNVKTKFSECAEFVQVKNFWYDAQVIKNRLIFEAERLASLRNCRTMAFKPFFYLQLSIVVIPDVESNRTALASK